MHAATQQSKTIKIPIIDDQSPLVITHASVECRKDVEQCMFTGRLPYDQVRKNSPELPRSQGLRLRNKSLCLLDWIFIG